jgi:signal transduction histidine kinase
VSVLRDSGARIEDATHADSQPGSSWASIKFSSYCIWPKPVSPRNYEFASVDAESLVFEVMNYLERLANQQGIRLQAVVEPGLTLLRADPDALFTLLKNLLENAIQHSRAGGVMQLERNRTSSRCRTKVRECRPKIFRTYLRASGGARIGAMPVQD